MTIFETDLNHMIDETNQDVYIASEDSNKAMYTNLEYIYKKFFQNMQQECHETEKKIKNMTNSIPIQPEYYAPGYNSTMSLCFSNVRLDPSFRISPNPFDSSTSLPDVNFR